MDSSLETLLFNAVGIADLDARDTYLRQVCGSDGGKLAELQSLVRDYFAAGSYLDRAATVPPTLAADPARNPCRQIGPYKLHELLGEGGMGCVYVAEQQRPVRRKVALKIIKPGMDSRQVISRFESERQALALMDHPNIAKVLDGGTTDNGLPYFVMELVKGEPITDYCDNHKLGTRQRLELFIQVCQAVQHAHQKGIIHRDIKPSNVMVTVHDVVPVVKVIDFGVAKAIGQQLTDNTLYTAISQMIGTPLYMSPEQAGESGLDIDTRSDVYSLGVVLYELLTGNTPFDKDSLKQAGFDEVRRIIREVEPPKPSHRVSTLKAEEQSTVADKRQSEPRRLSHQFRGELDWIVMKAIEKDRNRRYESAIALEADVQRYLAGDAVHACPPTRRYRFAKFARRNKSLLTTGVLVACAVFVGTVVSVMQAVRATQAEQVAKSGLNSEREARLAEQAARQEATQAKDLAQRNANSSHRQQYIAEMQLGRADLEAGNISRLYQTLVKYLPETGRIDQRGWEWYYLLSRCQEGRILCEHYNDVASVAYSPDGKYLATASLDGDAIVWEAQSGRKVRRFSVGGMLKRGLDWSPDSQRLAWGSLANENAIRIWDRRTDEIHILRGHTHSLMSCAWSPDGQRLATTSRDNTARIWDIESRECLHVLQGHESHVCGACWTRDGLSLVTVAAGKSNNIKVWNTISGELVRDIPSQFGFSSAAISSTIPQQIVLGNLDGECQILETDSWEVTHRFKAHAGQINAIAIRHDGRCWATGGQDGKVVVWDAVNQKQLSVLRTGHLSVSSLAWNPNGEQLVAGSNNGAVISWNLPLQPKPTTTVAATEPIGAIQWTHGDRGLAFDGLKTGVRINWDLSSDKIVTTNVDSSAIQHAISPDGQLKALVPPAEDNRGSKIVVKDYGSGETLFELEFTYTHSPRLVWSPDSRRLAAYSYKNTVLWEIRTGQRLFDWQGASIQSVTWTSDGRRIALAGGGDLSENGNQAYMSHIHIFDVEQKTRLLKQRTSNQRVLANTVAWNSTCDKIASGNGYGEIGVWDSATGDQIFKSRPHVASVWSLDWSPDGSRLASVSIDGSLKIQDASTGEELLSLDDSKQQLTSIKWSSDGVKLAAGDQAGQVYVWTAVPTNVASYSADRRRAMADMYASHSAQHLERGDVETAIEELTQAIELAPSRTSYRRARATCYAQLEQFEQALTDLAVALDFDPEDTFVLRTRVDIFARLERWPEALADASRLSELKQSVLYRYPVAVLQLVIGDLQAYKETCRQELICEESAFSFEAQRRAWTCSLAAGDMNAYQEFLALVREEMLRTSTPFPSSMGALLYRAGDVVQAIDALMETSREWEKAGSIEAPGSPFDLLPGYTWYFLAMANHDLGRYAESRSWYDKAEAYSQTMLVAKAGALNWHQRAVLELLQNETRSHIAVAPNK